MVPPLADPVIWQIGLLVALLFGVAAGGQVATLIVLAWGAGAMVAWTATLGLGFAAAPVVLAYVALAGLALGWGRPDLAGAALAPGTILFVAVLLPRRETAPAMVDWARLVAGWLWAVAATLGLAGLLTLPAPLGSFAVPVAGASLAYSAARRATTMQGLNTRVATGAALTLALFGAVLLSGGTYAVPAVLATTVGIGLSSVSPAPLAASRAPVAGMLAANQLLAFAAPLAFGTLWLARTFFY